MAVERTHHVGRIERALALVAETAGTRIALVDGTRRVSFAELSALSDAFAAGLQQRGVAPGDRVGIYLDKTVESIAAMYGAWRAGAIAVPINPTLKRRQVEHVVTHSGSRVVISSDRKIDAVQDVMRDVTVVDVTELEAGGEVTDRGLDDPAAAAAILYTSGSTGRAKGITLSHANLVAGARIVSTYLGITEDERILSVLPFSFDYGLNQLLTAVATGATLVLQRSMLSADICRALERHEITGLAGVPPLWIQLLDPSSPFAKMTFPKLRYVTNSGGALPVEIVKRYRELVPHTKIFLMYGLTEAFRSTYLPPEEVDRRPASMGRAIPECEILVVGEDGVTQVGPGEVGELVHRGPTVAIDYWADPEATAARFKASPFGDPTERVVYSGDLVKKDEDGFLYFVGRRDEMIKTLGYRVSPTEVEEVIYDSQLVSAVVVKGEPDPVAGKIIVAHCVPVDGQTFQAEKLLEHCRDELPAYMVPRVIRVHESFPRTASGKIDRAVVGS